MVIAERDLIVGSQDLSTEAGVSDTRCRDEVWASVVLRVGVPGGIWQIDSIRATFADHSQRRDT